MEANEEAPLKYSDSFGEKFSYGPWQARHNNLTDYLEDQEMDGYQLVAWRRVNTVKPAGLMLSSRLSHCESVWRKHDGHLHDDRIDTVVSRIDPVND